MKKLPFCVYVLKSQKDALLYIGYTTDLHRRLTEHIRGQSDATAPQAVLRDPILYEWLGIA